jgi:hypothetical protein
MVAAFGGRCCCCKYSKALSALEFHHVDPKTKDFGLGAIRGSFKAWDKIVAELRKCVMVCSNCHAEIHEGVRELPKKPRRFSEKFSKHKKLSPGKKPKSSF